MNIIWFTWKDLDHPQAGGAEVINEGLATRLAADGHKVTFLTAGFTGAAPTSTRQGFRIIRTGGRFTNYLTSARYYRRHFQELAPELVIDECNTMPYFAGAYSRVPTVLFFHMLCRRIWFYEFPKPLAAIGYVLEPLYLRLLGPKRTVVTVSDSTKADLARHGFPAPAIHIISEAVTAPSIPDPAIIKKFAAPTLLSHGSIRPMKRTLDQIKAFELAKAKIPNLRLIVSGQPKGEYGEKVIDYIKTSPHAASIRCVGRTTEANKLALMQKCHALLVTSVKEGWGLVVTEAATQGTPAIVYNVDGLRDSVRHNQTGLITEANTPPAMARSIEAFFDNSVNAGALGVAAWDWAKTMTFDQAYADFRAALKLE